MSIKSKVLATTAALALLGGVSVAATEGAEAAPAGTPGCAFTNGCATLHGVDAAGHAVAMDAKGKVGPLVIGYPDLPGDSATDYDAVLHYTNVKATTVWDDTEIFPVSAPVVTSSGPGSPKITSFAFVPATGTWAFHVDSDVSAPYTATVTGLPGATVTSPISASLSSYNAVLSVNGASNAPGIYDNVTLTLTDSKTPVAQTTTYTIAVRVYAHKVTIPGGKVPFYTFVLANNGVWSNKCDTANNGSGGVVLTTCSLGKNGYQDFYALDSTGTPSAALATSTASFRIQNLFLATGSANSCLVDLSTLNPAIPQNDVTDTSAGGRQLRTDYQCTTADSANQWRWAS